jgi:hypothetical protein
MKTILVFVVVLTLLRVIEHVRTRWMLDHISSFSDEKLRRILSKRKKFAFHCMAAGELKQRGVDITFSMPTFLSSAVSRNLGARFLGWSGLRAFFSETIPDIDFATYPPSKETITRLKMLLNRIENRTSESTLPCNARASHGA